MKSKFAEDGEGSVPRFGDDAVYAMVVIGTRIEGCDVEHTGNELARLAAAEGVPVALIPLPEYVGDGVAVVGLVAAYVSAAARRPVGLSREALQHVPSGALWSEVSRVCGQELEAPSWLLVATGPLAQAHLVEEAEDGDTIVGQDMDQRSWDATVVGREIAVANFEEPVEVLDLDQLSQATGRLLLVARYD